MLFTRALTSMLLLSTTVTYAHIPERCDVAPASEYGQYPAKPTRPQPSFSPIQQPAPTKPKPLKPEPRKPAPARPEPTQPAIVPPTFSRPGLPLVYKYIVEQTNIIRAHHNYKGVVWDQKLANEVQRKANLCDGTPHFKLVNEPKTAQNWAAGSPCAHGSGFNCVVERESEPWRWYEHEQPLWDYANKRCRGPKELCGHFVIMTQQNTYAIGCAVANCPLVRGINWRGPSVWCNYRGVTNGIDVNPPSITPNRNQRYLRQKLEQHYNEFLATNY